MSQDVDIDITLQHMARETEEDQARGVAAKLGLPYINLTGYPVAPDVLKIIPEKKAQQFYVIAYLRAGNKVRIATNEPTSPDVQKFLQAQAVESKVEFILSVCSASSMEYGLTLYEKLFPPQAKEDKVEVTQEKETNFEAEIKTFQDLKEKISTVSTTELLDIIFAGAIKNDSTDIHLEPQEVNFRVRYRIDGVLQDVAELPMAAYHQVVSRIKFFSKLKLDVTKPQDGRFSVTVLAAEVDIRVSSLPTAYGEAIVMRLLPKDKQFVDMQKLGFNKGAMEVIKDAVSKPQGMIINTGPTGSGKTTTLYAILQFLNQPGKKIITFENPIEYRIKGIEQIQVNDENKVGFLDALRAALRQDPDIMMIGEVRDPESANIALQAAMTGHLVLTTLHTNNAPSSLARLTEMGIEPYLLAGSINLIIAQRLVRTIHQACGGKGCDICHKTGYKGRAAIVEVLAPTKEIESLIMKKAPLREFEETAHRLGMKTMYEDGMEKVAAGITTKEEVLRVTKE